MKYKISISEDGTYVIIKAFDVITGVMEKEFAEIAIKEAKQRDISNFLVDVRGTKNIASSLEQYLFGYEDMNKFNLNIDSRIAVLVDANDSSHNFIETVLVNAGYLCRIFSATDAAVKWLRE